MSSSCTTTASCSDGIEDGSETDIDCGGVSCASCADGKKCIVGTDCQSRVCATGTCQAPTCSDGVENGAETDIDCGGGTCSQCSNGKHCLVSADCVSNNCQSQVCQ